MPSKLEIGLIWRLFEAINKRDIEAALDVLHPDVDWPNGPEAQRICGLEALRSCWLVSWAEMTPTVTPLGCCETTDGLSIAVHQIVRDRNGALLHDGHAHHLYRFKDELIHRLEIYP
jgi:hypothetical protein